MKSTDENIECKNKEGQTKLFSAKQLELIGKSADGSYDGWIPTDDKPPGIPDKVVIGGGPQGYDPNGGLQVDFIQSNPNGNASTTLESTDSTATTDGDQKQETGASDATVSTTGGEAGTSDTGAGSDATSQDGEGEGENGDENKGGADQAPNAEKVTKGKPGPKPKAAQS